MHPSSLIFTKISKNHNLEKMSKNEKKGENERTEMLF